MAVPLRARSDEAETLFQRGFAHYRDGDFTSAMDAFSEAIVHDPRDGEIQRFILLTGQRLLEKDDERETLPDERLQNIMRQAQTVLDERRRKQADLLKRAKTALAQSRRNAPATLLQACRGIELRMELPPVDDERNRAIERLIDETRDNLEKSLRRNSPFSPTERRVVAGYAAFGRYDWAEAADQWEKALAGGDDKHLAAMLQRARMNLEKSKILAQIYVLMEKARDAFAVGRYAEAAAVYEQVLTLDPTHPEAREKLSQTRRREERRTQEERLRALRRQAIDQQAAGRWLGAAQSWLDVLRIDPLHAEARANLAKARAKLDKPAASAPAGESNPAEAQRLYTLGMLDYNESRLKEAAGRFEESLRLDPKNDFSRKALDRVREELRYKK